MVQSSCFTARMRCLFIECQDHGTDNMCSKKIVAMVRLCGSGKSIHRQPTQGMIFPTYKKHRVVS